jgi:hypothetical protein
MLWVLSGALFIVWVVMKFVMNRGGFIHILLLSAISIFVVQFMAYRKTKYQENSAKR